MNIFETLHFLFVWIKHFTMSIADQQVSKYANETKTIELTTPFLSVCLSDPRVRSHSNMFDKIRLIFELLSEIYAAYARNVNIL